jgi:hypothetical protein
VKRIFAEGDFVMVHMHAKREPAEDGLAIVDIFRLDAGRLVEHWEVRQPIEQSKLHANSMNKKQTLGCSGAGALARGNSCCEAAEPCSISGKAIWKGCAPNYRLRYDPG